MRCAWAISNDCHETKKNCLVCTACWKEADEEKHETYKDLEGGWCRVVGCWNARHGPLHHAQQGAVTFTQCKDPDHAASEGVVEKAAAGSGE